MNNIYEDLKNYIENTPREEVDRVFEKTAEWDKIGPTVENFLAYTEEYYDELLTVLMQSTFHHSDEDAKQIVDKFVEHHPEILKKYTLEFLYKV